MSFRDEALNDTLALPIQTEAEAIVIEVVMHFGVHSSPVIAVILLIAFRRTCHPVVEVFQRNFVSSCVATERLSFKWLSSNVGSGYHPSAEPLSTFCEHR